MRSKPVIAIDGPSGAGKSTVARGLAKALGFSFVDTGALYRTVAMLADRAGVEWSDGDALARLAASHAFAFDADGNIKLDGEPLGDLIRTPRMSRGASIVAVHAEVRRALLEVQRDLGADGGVVLEGRDIGSVVFPDAEIKFYLDASVKARARRRFLELAAREEEITLDQVERDQEARDRADREREISPLVQAGDAVPLNCDDLSASQVIEEMISTVRDRFPLT
jgi:cytidylate kinase